MNKHAAFKLGYKAGLQSTKQSDLSIEEARRQIEAIDKFFEEMKDFDERFVNLAAPMSEIQEDAISSRLSEVFSDLKDSYSASFK